MTKQTFSIFQAKEGDNEELLDLARQCPMKGNITAYTDRSPFFFRMYKMLDDKYNVLIEHRNNKVSACMGSVHQKLFINNKLFDVAIWGDLKVAPKFRKGLSAIKLIREMINKEKRAGVKFALASIIEGNRESEVFTKGRAGLPKAHSIGKFILYNIVPTLNLKPDNEFYISAATPLDIQDMVRFYNEYYKNYNLSPRYTAESFSNMLSSFPGLSIDKFKIARKDNKIEAIAACWDQQSLQKYIVLNYSFSIKLLRNLMHFIGFFGSVPSFPEKGNPLKFIYLSFVAVRDINNSALKTILRTVNNEARGSDYSHFSICIREQENLKNAMKGMFYSGIHSSLYIYPLDENMPIEKINLHDKPVHAEYALMV